MSRWLTLLATAAVIGVHATAAAQQTLGQQPQTEPPPAAGLPTLGATSPSGFPLSTGGGPVAFYTQSMDDHFVSGVMGATVTNARKENIGVVRDLVMSKLGDVKAAIIDVSKYMGDKRSLIAVNLVSLQIRHEGKGVRVVLDTDREQLKTAPRFEPSGSGLEGLATGETPLPGPNAPR